MGLTRHVAVAQGGTFDDYTLTDDDFICDPATGLPIGGWSNQGTVVNKVDFKFNWNESDLRDDFGARQLYTGTTSVTRYSVQPGVTLESRGIHISVGGQTILNRAALLYLQRWGFPPPILVCRVPYRRHVMQSLDTLRVTCSKIPNVITGKVGLEDEIFEVISVQPRWGINGGLDLVLLWVGAIETSAVPVPSDALSLTQGTSTVDATDVGVPFGSSATVTTPVVCRKIRVGLKHQSLRVWRAIHDLYDQQGGKGGFECFLAGQTYDELSYNSRVRYHIDYKTAAAPDAPGSGSDPTTGFVPFVGSMERGNIAQFAQAACGGVAAVPGLDSWVEFRNEILPASPTSYNVRVYFDGITSHGDPIGEFVHIDCGAGGCTDVYVSSQLVLDQVDLKIDYIEAIT